MTLNTIRPMILKARESTGRNLGLTVKDGQFRLYDFQKVKVNGRARIQSNPLTGFTTDIAVIAAAINQIAA